MSYPVKIEVFIKNATEREREALVDNIPASHPDFKLSNEDAGFKMTAGGESIRGVAYSNVAEGFEEDAAALLADAIMGILPKSKGNIAVFIDEIDSNGNPKDLDAVYKF